MKTVRFSKIKLVYALFYQLVASAILLLSLNYLFSSELFEKRMDYFILATLFLAALMSLIYMFFIFVGPTVTSINFGADQLVIKYVKGYSERIVSYKDIKFIQKTGIMQNDYKICINGEIIPLFLMLFKKTDRISVFKTIEKYTATTYSAAENLRVDADAIPSPQPSVSTGKRGVLNAVKKVVAVCITIFVVLAIVVAIIGENVPETSVYTGRQIPGKFMEEIRSLNLIEKDEQIIYFYTDAMFDITSGLYFVTERNLVLYSNAWEAPEIIIPLDQIDSVDVEYDDSFWNDTNVYVTTYAGMEVSFPVSSENGLDRKFVEVLTKN